MIEPHGGKLINKFASKDKAIEIQSRTHSLKKLEVPYWILLEMENIADGIFSPLEGFMTKEEYVSVIKDMKLPTGVIWTIPIVFPVPEDIFRTIRIGENIAIYHQGELFGIITITDKYIRDVELESKEVYKTSSMDHPGVRFLWENPKTLIAGPIELTKRVPKGIFDKYYIPPADTRKLFKELGWETIVAFQTRNPPHRAHEYLQKVALEMTDGLFLNPLIGRTKKGDIPPEVRMETYQVLIRKYYPQNRVVLGVYPVNMRYAGPREAVFHAITRKNFGCTHFIVGRDHAGVGNFYGTYDAQKIFDNFKPEEIGITPLKFEHAFYCKKCGGMATSKTCPHDNQYHIFLSGTKVRKMLSKGELPPPEVMRPEIAKILLDYYRKQGGNQS